MKCLYCEKGFGELANHIGEAIKRINSFIAPFAQTGELIISIRSWRSQYRWQKLYHGTLDDGAGKSCAAAKINTLINHPQYGWTGVIPEAELKEGEMKWYGAIHLHLKNCRHLADEWEGEMIISFSGRKEWQDAIYVAAVLQVLDYEYKLPIGSEEDPIWGTALALVKETFSR